MQLNPKQLTPMPGYVLVEPEAKTEKSAGGIYLPANSEEKPQAGKVLAVGDSVWESGVKEVSSPVKSGDNVLYKKWGGNDVKIKGIEYQFLKFEDILAIIK